MLKYKIFTQYVIISEIYFYMHNKLFSMYFLLNKSSASFTLVELLKKMQIFSKQMYTYLDFSHNLNK